MHRLEDEPADTVRPPEASCSLAAILMDYTGYYVKIELLCILHRFVTSTAAPRAAGFAICMLCFDPIMDWKESEMVSNYTYSGISTVRATQ